jgi:Tol biopolymer transport system component
MIGKTLSHYSVTAALGAGGMGEVYRATDTALNRDVAIKVLPAEVAQDPERLARFRREAQLLASLNHPNIAAIHGLEEAEGTLFLALELVEGEDLRQRLERGAISLDETLEIAKQIAEALEEAHNKGIVHRDLKPANVKLTPDGKVKVLDFGLAKAYEGDPASGGSSMDLSQSPTLARSGTLAGVILGTAAYMSPEQASGKAVDRRADIWSFGVVLFEMLTGPRLFTGETASEILASVIKEEPSWDALPDGCPPAVVRLLRRCLRKRPRERLQDIGDARLELEDVLAGTVEEGRAEPDGGPSAAVAARRLARQRRVWAAVALVSAGLAALVSFLHLTEVPEARPAAHFVLDTPGDLAFWEFNPLAVSPDGRHVAFIGVSPDSDQQLWIRSLDSPEARALPGTEGVLGGYFWSADSTSIAFAAEGALRKLTLAGGTVQRLCALPAQGFFNGGTWSREGTIVISGGGPSARLYSVSETGGEARPLTSLDASRNETAHWAPQFLPDGRQLLFVVNGGAGEHAGLHVISLDAPAERRRIRPGGTTHFRYAPPGHLLFVQDGILLAQPFDAKKLVTLGEAVPLASAVAAFTPMSGWGSFSASTTGRVAWLSGQGSADVWLEWVDREGGRLGTLGDAGPYGQIALSPDGRRVAVDVPVDGEYDIWTIDVARGIASRVTTEPTEEWGPVWSPDGRELAYEGGPTGGDLYRRELRAGATASLLLETAEREVPEDWSRDGKILLYLVIGEERSFWALPLEGDGSPELVLKTGFNLDEPQLSPDGHWLAYISAESGRYEVYVEPFRQPGERVRVSPDGGGQPKWRGDGKELFYLSPDGALMAVDVGEGASGLEVGIPTVLVPGDDLRAVLQGPDFDDYAVTADGQRFLVKRSAEEDIRQRIHVVVDWPSLLEN